MKKRRYFQRERYQRNGPRRPGAFAGRYGKAMPANHTAVSSLFAGRLAVIGAIFVFMASYAYGIYQYGWWLGLAAGWLPSVAFTWLSAQLIAKGVGYVVPEGADTLRYGSRFKYLSVPFCCSGKANIGLKYRRQHK